MVKQLKQPPGGVGCLEARNKDDPTARADLRL